MKGAATKGNCVLVFGAIHAREYITSELVLRICESFCPGNREGVFFVPMLNIDGVMLSTQYSMRNAQCAMEDFNFNIYKTAQGGGGIAMRNMQNRIKNLIRINNGSVDFSLWKANIHAVDLNVNFDADFGKGKSNVRYPAPENYIGPYPFSEPESRAIGDFTCKIQPKAVVAYHTKGEEIYYGYRGIRQYPEEAIKFADILGYPLIDSAGSAGGYKDWYTMNFDGLGLTVEIGNDTLTHPITGLTDKCISDNIKVVKGLARFASHP